MKVLIAEDDVNIRQGLAEILELEGYQVFQAANGLEALQLFSLEKPDFLCLDIMMPGKSGYDVCKEIRLKNESVPIIFISAKSEEIDKVLGLELGADDYILKPFGVKEVVARIRAITRRCFLSNKKQKLIASFQMGPLEVLPQELRAMSNKQQIELSLREVKILKLLFDNCGKAVDRDTLLNQCWGMNYFPNSRTLEQTISNLRKKIELDVNNPAIIKTVHGVGYRFE